MKSNICFSKTTKAPLSVYMTEQEAQQSANHQILNGRFLYPYLCKKCGLWHLAPTESRINVFHNACHCLDSKGNHKDLYQTREDAEKAKNKREAEGSGTLYVYKCPCRTGYHLTHKEPW